MAFREMKLGQARKLVKEGKVAAVQIEGLESWPDDAVVTVPVTDDAAATQLEAAKPGRRVSQEEGLPAVEPAIDPIEPTAPTEG